MIKTYCNIDFNNCRNNNAKNTPGDPHCERHLPKFTHRNALGLISRGSMIIMMMMMMMIAIVINDDD